MRVLALFVVYYASAGYALINPLYGVLFFVHIMIFRPENLAWETAIFGRLHLITALCTAIGYLVRRDGVARFSTFQRNNLLVFAALAAWFWLISGAAVVSVDDSLDRALDMTKIFLFCLLLSLLMSSAARVRLYVIVASASCGLLGLWGVAQGMAGNWRLDNIWIAGSNYLAALLALVIPCTLTAALDRGFPRWIRIGLIGCVAAMTLCLVYTDSRGGFLALIGGLVSLVVLAKQRGKLLIGLFVLVLIVYPLIPSEYGKRVSGLIEEDAEADLSAESRPILWRLALRMWQDYPVFGVGLDNFPLVIDSYAASSDDLVKSPAMAELIFGRRRAPHGLYTGMLAESGVVGLGLFLTLIVRCIACRLDSGGSLALIGRGVQAGVIGFAIGSVFGDYQYIDVLYWQLMLIGAIVSLQKAGDGSPATESNGRMSKADLSPGDRG